MNASNAALLDTLFDDVLIEDLSGFQGDNDIYNIANEVTTYVTNQWVTSKEDVYIGEKKANFTIRTRFVAPILSSMALRHTNAKTFTGTRVDFNATVVAQRQLEIMSPDGSWVGLLDFCIAALRKMNPTLTMSDTDLALKLKNYGFDPEGKLPMYLQHLGASEEQFIENAKHFASLGAQPNRDQVRGQAQGTKSTVEYSWRHQEGVPLTSLDISKVDRNQSENHTGFIGFMDAAFNTFLKIVAFDKQRSANRAVPTDSELYMAAQKSEADIRNLFSTARTLRAFRNLGGTTAVTKTDVLDETAAAVTTYYAQQVPCGRFSVRDERFGLNPDATETYSVWRARAISASETASIAAKDAELIMPELDEALGSF